MYGYCVKYGNICESIRWLRLQLHRTRKYEFHIGRAEFEFKQSLLLDRLRIRVNNGGAASMFAALYSNVVQGRGPPGAFMRYTPNFYCALGLMLVGSAVEVVVGARGVWY